MLKLTETAFTVSVCAGVPKVTVDSSANFMRGSRVSCREMM